MIAAKLKITFLLLPLCLMLCSCYTYNAENVIPEPSVQLGMSPQQILEEQTIDDTHDAFLIDTGGQLGMLLVTSELERTPSKDCNLTVHFSVWDPASMDEPLQTLTTETNLYQVHCYTIDANFDGYGDFTFTYLQGNQIYRDHLWVWNEYHKRFEGVPEYDDISVPSLDEEAKTIYGFDPTSGGGTGLHTFHQWVEGNLLCMRQIEIESIDQQNTVRMSIRDRVADELVETHHEDFTSESSGWLDAQIVWHDLNYRGEPGGIYDVFQQQPIDNFHDAFLVDTWGKLGTLLVAAELVTENKNEFGTRDITFTVWNPAEMEQPIQTFTEEFMMGVAPEFHDVVDANFDGFQDFGYLFHAGNQPNYWRYWLWDQEQAQFIYYEPFVDISAPAFDAEQQVVTGWLRSGAASGTHTLYRWIDGELTLVRVIKFDCFDPNIQSVTIEDWLDGEMVAEYQREYEFVLEAYDMISKWFDLDYHGESTEEN